jgi:hypothetical protein
MGVLRGIARVGSRGGTLCSKISVAVFKKGLCEWNWVVSGGVARIALSSPRWSGSGGPHGIGDGIVWKGQGGWDNELTATSGTAY